MYLYYDKNGLLREIINEDEPHRGSVNYNKINIYVEGYEEILKGFAVFKSGDGLTSVETILSDGSVETSNEILVTKGVAKELPYNAKRDLKFFKYFTPYKFFEITIPDNILSKGGLTLLTFRLVLEDDSTIKALDLFPFTIKNNVINVDNEITISQYNYLLQLIASLPDSAKQIFYDNTKTYLPANNVQDAIDNIKINMPFDRFDVDVMNEVTSNWQKYTGKILFFNFENSGDGIDGVTLDSECFGFLVSVSGSLIITDLQNSYVIREEVIGEYKVKRVNQDLFDLKANQTSLDETNAKLNTLDGQAVKIVHQDLTDVEQGIVRDNIGIDKLPFKTINNESIKGVGDIKLPTKEEVDTEIDNRGYQTAVDVKGLIDTNAILLTEKGVANGVATLDENGKVKAEQLDISGVYRYKGSVATYDNLPTTQREIGDVWNVEDTGKNYAWDGTRWDDLGGIGGGGTDPEDKAQIQTNKNDISTLQDDVNHISGVDIVNLDQNKLDKASEKEIVYATDTQGNQVTLQYNKDAIGGGLAQRNNDGTIVVATPVKENDATTKKYVDDKVSGKQDKLGVNATAPATDTLTKITIDNTIYDVGGDGSGDVASVENKTLDFKTSVNTGVVEANNGQATTDTLNSLRIKDINYKVGDGSGSLPSVNVTPDEWYNDKLLPLNLEKVSNNKGLVILAVQRDRENSSIFYYLPCEENPGNSDKLKTWYFIYRDVFAKLFVILSIDALGYITKETIDDTKANPTLGTPQGDLTSIEIGGKKYTIPTSSYTLPMATEQDLGGVRVKTATDDQTDFVGIDSQGLLKVKPAGGGSGGDLDLSYIEIDPLIGTWRFIDNMVKPKNELVQFDLSFESNGETFNKMITNKSFTDSYMILTYGDKTIFNGSPWSDEKSKEYQIITILDTKNLTNRDVFEPWLNANAEKF